MTKANMSATLLELRVSDLGIIEELSVLLERGLTVVTGETGAGKTLVMTALALLGGARADSSMVRAGASEARVEGRFFDPVTDEEIVLVRVVPLDGRSRAYVNGGLVTIGELADRCASLVDMHGQHSHQSLLDPSMQTKLLDRFCGDPAFDRLASYRQARLLVNESEEKLSALGGDERARAREMDLLKFQIDELESASLEDPNEAELLEAEEELLSDAEAHQNALRAAYDALQGIASDAIGAATSALAGRAPFAAHEIRIRGLQAEVADAAHDVRDTLETVVVDPVRLSSVQERRRLLRDLGRKYGATCADMIAFLNETQNRYDEIASYAQRAADAEVSIANARAAQQKAGLALSEVRREAAGTLAAAVESHLVRLAMPSARFVVEVERGEETEDGEDRVVFVLSANAGEPLKPLARAASGGELSRSMLAVRVALHSAASNAAVHIGAVPLLVFDEVDAGIGGEAGIAVGRELADLGNAGQVLCVTHLAQVAAFADHQIVVTKRSVAKRTVATAEVVTDEARISELSRMLAGVGSSEHARRHAEELINSAGVTRIGTDTGISE